MDKTPLQEELDYENAKEVRLADEEQKEEEQRGSHAEICANIEALKVYDQVAELTRRRQLKGLEYAMSLSALLLDSVEIIIESAGYEHLSKAIHNARQGEV